MAKESETFEENFRKLESLSLELQENKISVDQLVPRIKEALSAIRICRQVLGQTKLQLTEINAEFSQLENQTSEEKG